MPTLDSNYLIIVECKASATKHKSPNYDKPKDYAIDGVLHYSKYISKEFNVLSIAVSGEYETELLVNLFLQKKGGETAKKLQDSKLLSIYDCVRLFENENLNYNLKNVDIVSKAVKLNEDFQNCSVPEGARNTIVSAIHLALQDGMFSISYSKADSSRNLASSLIEAVERVLRVEKTRKIEDMMGVYNSIFNQTIITDPTVKRGKKEIETVVFLKETIDYLQRNVFPLTKCEQDGYDILGRFYTEFVRYASSKQKQGLVLTPSHVTNLFCDLVQLKATDIVYDPCCGTGGFLIAAMKRMMEHAGNDTALKENIRSNQLLGVDNAPEMFTFACSNMMMRGDGKSNLDRGNCFVKEVALRIKSFKPTVSFLNPPYDVGTDGQLHFIETALEAVREQNGKVVAIVQMSCGLKNDAETVAVRKRLLDRYTLKAVISMPDQLFYPVGVVACVMVFDSSAPNMGKKTWFGYMKDDGFVLRKNKGRIDQFNRWDGIKSKLLKAYFDGDEAPGLSVKKEVTEKDEWCAEAYMETDYSNNISPLDFERTIKRYVLFKQMGPEFGDEHNDCD